MQADVGHRAAQMRVELLGEVRVWRDGEPTGGPPQRRAVLALLALADGHPVPREDLTAALWPDSPPPRATNIIQTHVKHLRQELEPDRPSRTASTVLPAVGSAYALRVDASDVDVHRFRALVAEARDARGADDRDRLWRATSEAVRLWRTPVADLPVLHAHPRVLALVAEWQLVFAWHVDAAIDRGRADEVLPRLEEHARDRPLDERIQVRLLRAYRAVGRRGAAFAAYRQVRRDLVTELGVDPCAELAAAHRELLRDDPPPTGAARVRPRVASTPDWPVRPVSSLRLPEPRRPPEDQARCAESSRLELLRTWDVLARVLPSPPAVLLDVGGGARRFAGQLAQAGYTVHATGPGGGAAARPADDPRTPCPTDRFDAVLLLDPHRHPADRSDRVRAWQRAARSVRSGGLVVAAVGNRFAAALEGLLRSGRFQDGPCGPDVVPCRACPDGPRPAAEYRHHPDELPDELAEGGLRLDRVVAVDAPVWAFSGLSSLLDDPGRVTQLLDELRKLEEEPGLLGISGRLLALASPDVAAVSR